jgi:hypothetical protein
MKYLAPLLLALRSLVQQSKSLKSQFSQESTKILVQLVSQSQSQKDFKNVYVSGLILMCELDVDDSLIQQQIKHM